LIIKDTVNDGVAFLMHLKVDHEIFYTPQRMTKAKTRDNASKQALAPPEESSRVSADK